MTRTLLDLDDEALMKAQHVLGTTTKVSTVNAALRRVAAEEERRHALMREMARGEQFAVLEHRDDLWR